jgi:predicted permease
MSIPFHNLLVALSPQQLPQVRLASMFIVLLFALAAGHLAAHRLGLDPKWAKKIMTAVLIFFDSSISLLAIWPIRLTRELIWLPTIGLILILVLTAFSAVVFRPNRFDPETRLTLIIGSAFSNVGYTGAAFVCYALFGQTGLAMANIYLLFSVPAFYIIGLPFLKARELRTQNRSAKLDLRFILDPRCLAIPATIAAIVLNLAGVKPPVLLSRLYVVDVLVYIGSALAFFAIGMQVNLSRLKTYTHLYWPVSAIKFILTPALAGLIIWLLLLSGWRLTYPLAMVIIVLSAAPCAVLMVTMSSVFDLNGPLAGALWVVTMTIFALLVVPVFFFIFT